MHWTRLHRPGVFSTNPAEQGTKATKVTGYVSNQPYVETQKLCILRYFNGPKRLLETTQMSNAVPRSLLFDLSCLYNSAHSNNSCIKFMPSNQKYLKCLSKSPLKNTRIQKGGMDWHAHNTLEHPPTSAFWWSLPKNQLLEGSGWRRFEHQPQSWDKVSSVQCTRSHAFSKDPKNYK